MWPNVNNVLSLTHLDLVTILKHNIGMLTAHILIMTLGEHDKLAPQCSECNDEATHFEDSNDAWYCDAHACDHLDRTAYCCLICDADLTGRGE